MDATDTSGLSTAELIALGAPIVLRDGSRVRIRQGVPGDRELLIRGFERLSPDSRYRRFLVPMVALREDQIDQLTDVDHRDREAIIALDEAGEGIAVARYVRDPDRPDAAEVAVTVIDDWQGRGLGTLLLDMITARAREEGISVFTALMLAANTEMLDLLAHLDSIKVVDREPGTIEIEVPLRERGLAPGLQRLLGLCAREHVTAAPAQPRPASVTSRGGASGVRRP
jgi:GNAT superfamily N-acetyltransferase